MSTCLKSVTTISKCQIHRCSNPYNKAFKSDSQRLAFFIPLLSSVFTVVRLSFVVALFTP
ncbi:hypothetical protein CGJ87_25035 [Vibrio parahaemolyticus]|nr:hypothetical protein [Vibrio parahaemolyticus]QDG85080.1 hypothetical protein FKM99_16330 [Vibrio parahaemolyticus]TOC25998.1 hypothetical protein CGJ87_25035 [Vibrio parahaemolyticus]TOD02175.1 hypothetical protein CGJ71_24410 [Vibrio parahaemolyticus]TOD04685.1 hypothetical protein CGJ73_24540 [Vibrio parahaemolyticus]